MKKSFKKPVIFLAIALALVFLFEHELVWQNIEKIGALATALALSAAMYQSYVAWMAAKSTSESNSQNFFQQNFNLILEQHNNLLLSVNDWLKKNENINNKPTEIAVSYIRGHEVLSPYMRILYHTLKNIASELPVTSQDPIIIIKNQKKYSSLVRSFIPNNLLYLVAVNASVINKRHFSIRGSKEYAQYQHMLIEFDFFEHLIISKTERIKLSESMRTICDFTHNACLAFYMLKSGITHDSDSEKAHTNEFDNLLNNTDFFLCLAYNFHNKFISVPEYVPKTKTIKKLIPVYINYYLSLLSKDTLEKFIADGINKIIANVISNVIAHENYYYDYSRTSGTSGLFYGQAICNYFNKKIDFNNDKHDLLLFRDGFHSELSELIQKNCNDYGPIKFKERDIAIARRNISAHIEVLLTKLINIKHIMDYQLSTEEILIKKKKELIDHITNKI